MSTKKGSKGGASSKAAPAPIPALKANKQQQQQQSNGKRARAEAADDPTANEEALTALFSKVDTAHQSLFRLKSRFNKDLTSLRAKYASERAGILVEQHTLLSQLPEFWKVVFSHLDENEDEPLFNEVDAMFLDNLVAITDKEVEYDQGEGDQEDSQTETVAKAAKKQEKGKKKGKDAAQEEEEEADDEEDGKDLFEEEYKLEGFQLTFHFKENPFFSNRTLTKAFYFPPDLDEDEDIDEMELEEAEEEGDKEVDEEVEQKVKQHVAKAAAATAAKESKKEKEKQVKKKGGKKDEEEEELADEAADDEEEEEVLEGLDDGDDELVSLVTADNIQWKKTDSAKGLSDAEKSSSFFVNFFDESAEDPMAETATRIRDYFVENALEFYENKMDGEEDEEEEQGEQDEEEKGEDDMEEEQVKPAKQQSKVKGGKTQQASKVEGKQEQQKGNGNSAKAAQNKAKTTDVKPPAKKQKTK